MHYVYVFHGEFQSILCKHVQQNGDVWQGALVQGIESLCPIMNSHKVHPKAFTVFLLTFLLKSLECLPKLELWKISFTFGGNYCQEIKKAHTTEGLSNGCLPMSLKWDSKTVWSKTLLSCRLACSWANIRGNAHNWKLTLQHVTPKHDLLVF